LLADLVREHRHRVGLTQEDLADQCGVAVRTIRGIEGGRIVRPRPATARMLADVFALTGKDRERFLQEALDDAGPTADQVNPAATRPVPAQLPADVSAFTGRNAELAALDALIAADAATTAVISAVSGTAGVGKTALAVRWGHRAADRFPDGQLYLNLRGYDPDQPVTPIEALAHLLETLGVRGADIPVELQACAAAYRSRIAGRRTLILLDNAANVDQVRPLLPGSPSCTVVITSRDRMTGLVARDGAHRVDLDLLPQDDATALLRRLVGERVDAEPDATAALADLCARLPLALRIAAELAAARPDTPLADLADELADHQRRLNLLDADGDPLTDITAVFSWSLRHLSPGAVNLFGLLGLHPGPDIAAPAAASLAGVAPGVVRPWLAELTQAHLLTEPGPDRYAFHDLLRAYANLRSLRDDPDDVRRAALTRLLDHYTHTAHAAERLLNPDREPMPLALAPPAAGTTVEHLDRQGAMDWLVAERAALLAAIGRAATDGFDSQAWQLAWSLSTILDRSGHLRDRLAAWQTALPAAGRLGHPEAEALAHRNVANSASDLGRMDEVAPHLEAALAIATRSGNRFDQALAHRHLGYMYERRGGLDQSLYHAQQALDLMRAIGHRRGTAHLLNSVGWGYAQVGDHSRALEHCEEALALLEQIGDLKGQANARDSLGYAHHHLGHHAQAVDCYHRAIDLFRSLGDNHGQADVLHRLGDTQLAAGDPEAARTTWRQSLDILRAIDHYEVGVVQAKLDGLSDGKGLREGGDLGEVTRGQ
jgi:tetratricopeptide (TPR) repeat protein/DNA-binding XRE family transcriptional regulator